MAFVNNNGTRIYYRIEGSGLPLVIQHGLSTNMEDWYEWGYVEALKNDFQLILIDARGHGQSDKPHDPKQSGFDIMAKDVIAVLDDLAISKTHYMGYSMGGLIAFRLADFAPERFHSMIIGDADPYTIFGEFHRELFKIGLKANIEFFAGSIPISDSLRRRIEANDFEALYAVVGIDSSDTSHVPSTMNMPCLVYACESSPLYSSIERCVKKMPNATFVSLPGLDHVQGYYRSDLTLPHIKKFLAKVTNRCG